MKDKIWAIVGAILFILTGSFIFEKKKADKAQADADLADLKGKDNLLKYQQDQDTKTVAEEQAKINQLKKPEAKDLPPNEAADYWNKKDS